MAAASRIVPLKSSDVFPGPRAFNAEEGRLFFGRQREVSQIVDLLKTYQDVFLYSQSGAGKTSLINAALVPKLGAKSCYVGRVGGELPRDAKTDKFENIFDYNLLASLTGGPANKPSHWAQLQQLFRSSNDHAETFLFIDQLEEVFTHYPERWADRRPFFEHLQSVLAANPDLHLLLAIREEYVASAEFYSHLFPNQLRIRYHLQGLQEDQASEAIGTPLSMAGFTIDGTTTSELVNRLREVPVKTPTGLKRIPGEFVEPLHLQIVCRNLLTQLQPAPRKITADEIKAYADVDQTLSDVYERVVAIAVHECDVDEASIRSWFDCALITPAGTRGLAFQGDEETAGLPNAAVSVLARENMVRAERRSGGALWFELTHDRFIDPIRESNAKWRERSQMPSFGQRLWPDTELDDWLKFKSVEIGDNRALEHHARMPKEEVVRRYLATLSPEEAGLRAQENWKQAELYLANDVLDGKFDLVQSLTPESYWRVEGKDGKCWLGEVKMLKAYLNWKARKESSKPTGAQEDYSTACEQIYNHLLNPKRKRSPESFQPIQQYLEAGFLKDSKLDPRGAKTRHWIDVKSQRLLELGHVPAIEKGQAAAELQMTMFYEHIPLAISAREMQSKESTRSVLRALGLLPRFEHCEAIVNCLEMAIAICFLDPEKIKHILTERDDYSSLAPG